MEQDQVSNYEAAEGDAGAGSSPSWPDARVVIIGAGISGVLSAIQMKQRGCQVRVLEKGADVGGVWHHNRYPGVACDTTAHSYVYSFAPRAPFSRRVATGQEMQAYYRSVADHYGITPLISFNSEVTSCTWEGSTWRIVSGMGEEILADIVICATGRLHHPAFPDIPGLNRFSGRTVHTALWDETLELTGKRVGIIGTGSTAAQIISEIAPEVAHLTVFQRTPQWVRAMPDYAIPAETLERIHTDDEAATAYYQAVLRDMETEAEAVFRGDPEFLEKLQVEILSGLDTVADSKLREKLTPDYEIGCKRLVVSADWYEVIQRDNVEVVCEPICEIDAAGIIAADGRRHDLDVLILATGFKSDAIMRPMDLRGIGGLSIDELWRDDLVSYRSVGIPGMPNFFTINGPFSPGGRFSYTTWIEIQSVLICRLIDKVLADRCAIMPRLDAALQSVAHIRSRMENTVFVTGGCKSWALDAKGRPLVDFPDPHELELEMRTAPFSDFETFAL